MRDTRNFRRLAAGALLGVVALSAVAQEAYPKGPIKLVVPYSAGAVTDMLGLNKMPHITIEVPASLAGKIDWHPCFLDMHRNLAAQGYGRLENFKSRVLILDTRVAGGDWGQCCVKVGNTPAEDYFNSHLNPPPLKEGKFNPGERAWSDGGALIRTSHKRNGGRTLPFRRCRARDAAA